jgi:hypothetical protein
MVRIDTATPKVQNRQAVSKVKHGISPHSAAFSLSPFDGTRSVSHISPLRRRVGGWAASGAQTSAPQQRWWDRRGTLGENK